MKTKMFMMAMMMTIATSAMSANHPKPQCEPNHHHECTSNLDCRDHQHSQRQNVDRCPVCGKHAFTQKQPDPMPQKPATKSQPKKNFGSLKSRNFGSHR